MKKIILAAIAAFTLTTLAACNTIEGIGEDVEATGKVVKDTARKTKD